MGANMGLKVGVPTGQLDRARANLGNIKAGNVKQGDTTAKKNFDIFLTDPSATPDEKNFALYLKGATTAPTVGTGELKSVYDRAQVAAQQATKAGIPLEDAFNPASPNEAISPEGRMALAEKAQREELATKQKGQIEQFGTEYTTAAEDKRKTLADRLSAQTKELETQQQGELGQYEQGLATSRQKTFEQANPFILEDLNRRGLLSSETATGQAQADAIKGLQTQDESKLAQARLGLFENLQGFQEQGNQALTGFEQGAFDEGQGIKGDALSTLVGGSQSALDAALGLRRGALERQYSMADAANERAYASSLAKKQRQNSLYSAGIGAAGNLVSSGVAAACFDRWTKVDMPDGSKKAISDVKLGDEIKGGTVTSIRIAQGHEGDLYFYKDVLVTGSHAVKHKEQWIRVEDAFGATKVQGSGIVYNLVTSGHRIFVNDTEFADEIEHDGGQYTGMEESLAILNGREVSHAQN